MELNLVGKNALVGGSSKGIGKAAAIELAKLGANITLVSRSADKMAAVLRTLDTSLGQSHDFLTADFSDVKDLEKRVKALVAQKPIHILINNTGGPAPGPIVDAKIEAFLGALNNHLVASHTLVQLVVEGMKAAGYGRIINVISTSVKEPIPGLGVSNTTRAAMANWSKTMAGELGQYGITVNNVLPGFTRTERLQQIIDRKAKNGNMSEEEVVASMKKNVPLGRFAEPRELGMAVAFLAAPAASYITGTNLTVDGGRTKSL
ncbi:MAG: SDR family oxidoreductase [Bacteroidota bacterium]